MRVCVVQPSLPSMFLRVGKRYVTQGATSLVPPCACIKATRGGRSVSTPRVHQHCGRTTLIASSLKPVCRALPLNYPAFCAVCFFWTTLPHVCSCLLLDHAALLLLCGPALPQTEWKGVLRSKGYFWLASRHNVMGAWQSAGAAWQGEPKWVLKTGQLAAINVKILLHMRALLTVAHTTACA